MVMCRWSKTSQLAKIDICESFYFLVHLSNRQLAVDKKEYALLSCIAKDRKGHDDHTLLELPLICCGSVLVTVVCEHGSGTDHQASC